MCNPYPSPNRWADLLQIWERNALSGYIRGYRAVFLFWAVMQVKQVFCSFLPTLSFGWYRNGWKSFAASSSIYCFLAEKQKKSKKRKKSIKTCCCANLEVTNCRAASIIVLVHTRGPQTHNCKNGTATNHLFVTSNQSIFRPIKIPILYFKNIKFYLLKVFIRTCHFLLKFIIIGLIFKKLYKNHFIRV